MGTASHVGRSDGPYVGAQVLQGYVLHTRHKTWLQPRHTTEQSPHSRWPAGHVAVRAPSRMWQFWQRVTTASGDAAGGANGDGAAAGARGPANGAGAATGGANGAGAAMGAANGDGAATGGANGDGATATGAAAGGLGAAAHAAHARMPHDRQISAPHVLHGIVQSGHMRCCLPQVTIGCACDPQFEQERTMSFLRSLGSPEVHAIHVEPSGVTE